MEHLGLMESGWWIDGIMEYYGHLWDYDHNPRAEPGNFEGKNWMGNLVGGWALPLWKMMEWVRHLGWWKSQWKVIKIVPNHQPGNWMELVDGKKIRVIPVLGFDGLESIAREFSDDLVMIFMGVLLIGFVAVDISWDCADLWGLMVIYVDITNYIRDYNGL